MRWSPTERTHIDDRRASGRMVRGGGLGLGGLLILLLLSWATGTDLLSLLGSGALPTQTTQPSGAPGELQTSPEEERLVDYVNVVVADAAAMWTRALQGRYQPTKAVLFRERVQSGCGVGESATGPFYCPADGLIYLDLSFFSELDRRFGAPGDFAQAYVVAHEFGHHIQNLLGYNARVTQLQQQRPDQANELSVRLELQADCFAGVWGHATMQPGRPEGAPSMEEGDVDEGMRAAAAIGDDRLQRMGGRGVQPESFTHGTSEQRVSWLRRGLQSGDPNACDTFSARGTN